jgi:YD repeat-containing protein
MTLTAAGNPYTGTPTIESGVTVKVEPGVNLTLGTLTVEGTLKAEGTAEAPVAFKPATEGGKWGGIVFKPGSSGSVLDHAEVVRAGPSWGNAIEIKESSPTITHSTIRESTYFGIYVMGGSPEIAHNTFSGGSIAFYANAEAGKTLGINFHDNLVEKFYGSAAIFIGAPATTVATSLGGNTVTNNSSLQAIYYQGGTTGEVPPDIANNSVYGNTGGASTNQVAFSGLLNKSATWESPTAPLHLESELKVAGSATLTLKPGVTIHGGSMKVSGTLKAEGEPSKLVTFEPRSESGHCGGIVFEPGSGASVLDHAEIYRCTGGTNGGAIEVKGSSPTITSSTIRGSSNYGIMVLESGSPSIKWDRFRGNTNGLSYTGTGKLSAPNNDWECASGPKPAGCGNSVTTNVEWKPAVQLPELAGHCRGKESQCGEGADPVSLATGQLDYSHQDLLLTNKSEMPLEFTRVYNSGSASDTGLGPGWSQTGLASAMELAGGEVLVVRQDGRQDIFEKAESGYKAPSGVTDTLAKVEGIFQLTALQGMVYRFDSSGRIVSVTDSHGLKTTYAYNAEGRLATITDSSAQTLTFTYNGTNHITVVKDSTGREVKFGYSAAGDLETVTDALGGVTKCAYDAQHRMTSITDPRGNVILKNVFNGEGKITEQQDGLSHVWKLEYKPSETIVTEPEGGKRKFGFDAQDRVVSETDQLGHPTTTAYDEAGNVHEVVQPGGAKWTFGHDAAGNLTSVKDPEGGERKYEYNAQNRPIVFTDARGNAWGYEWSKAGDLLKIADPESGETTLTYNESGQPLTKTDPDKHKTEFSYDSRGNELSETDSLSHKTSFEYNSRNFLIAKTAPGLKAEKFERDALGDMLSRTTPESNKTKYAYDANGLPTQITDPGENVWKIERNAMERPTAYIDPLAQQIKTTYNGNLEPIKVVNRRGKETIYAYNAANQLTEVNRPQKAKTGTMATTPAATAQA